MKIRSLPILLSSACWLLVITVCPVLAQKQAAPWAAPLATPLAAPLATSQPLVIGTKLAAPFAIKNQDGSWSGISIDLWRSIATELGLTFHLQETDLQGLLNGVQDGTFDASVAALTITSEREKTVDLTHSFHSTGLSIAVPLRSQVKMKTRR